MGLLNNDDVLKQFGILFVVTVFFPEQCLDMVGLDKISSIDIQGKEISISVEMPLSFENGEDQIT